jgi:hypothetical protein
MKRRTRSLVALFALVASALVTSAAVPSSADAATCTYGGGRVEARTFLSAGSAYDYVVFGWASLPGCDLGAISVEAVPLPSNTATPATCPPQVLAIGALGDSLAACASFRGIGGVGVGTTHVTLLSQVVGVSANGTRVTGTGSCPVTLTPTVGSGGECLI